MSDDVIHLITSAVKAFGAAHCAVPHIKIESETTPSDLDINDEARWTLRVILIDRAPTEGALPTADGPRYSREWLVTGPDYPAALADMARTILLDMQAQMVDLTKKLNAMGDAVDMLLVTVPVEGAAEEPKKIVQVAASVRPAR